MGVYLGKIPVGVIVASGNGNFIPCNVEQIIKDEFYCEIHITEGTSDSKYRLGWVVDGEHQSLYIVEK